jgi:MoaA/NifB/PqqE/SkfB family radical SAM enzyme
MSYYPYLERIVWLGGEVFLYKDFEELFDRALAFPSMQQQIITNGVALNRHWIEKIVKAGAELTFSIDGVTKQVYEYIRAGSNFEKLIANVRLVNEMRAKYTSKTKMRLNAVIMKSNYHQIEDFADFAREHGFCQVSLMALHFDVDPQENILYTHADQHVLEYITDAIPRIREKAKNYGIDLDVLLPTLKKEEPAGVPGTGCKVSAEPEKDTLHCKMPWKYMFICDKGTVYLTGSCAKPIGNVYQNSLDEIWNSPDARLYRENMVKNQFNDICRPECRTRWEI